MSNETRYIRTSCQSQKNNINNHHKHHIFNSKTSIEVPTQQTETTFTNNDNENDEYERIIFQCFISIAIVIVDTPPAYTNTNKRT